VAPLHDLATVDVPRQVDEQIAVRQMARQQVAHIVRGDPVLDEGHSALQPWPQCRLVRLEIHNGDAPWIDPYMVQKDRQRAPRNGSEAQEQDAFLEGCHSMSSLFPCDWGGRTYTCLVKKT